MRYIALLVAVAAACGGGSDSPRDSGIDSPAPDPDPVVPVLTSFFATPGSVSAGVPTMVTWNWTYATPTVPDPACTIDNSVGAVTRGQATSVTISDVTTFTLSCTNVAGSDQRQVILAPTPTAPVITSFTTTPATVMPDAPTNVTWTWTYQTPPSPTPTCTIEHGVGTVTPGAATSVTQNGTRIYRIRCTNGVGSVAIAQATIGVDECAAGTHACGANSTCQNTTESYSCPCNANFVLPSTSTNCSAVVNCPTTPCGANATCTSVGVQTACVCNAGYIGDGTSCARQRVAFITSTSGNGSLSSLAWDADAGAATGVARADAICQARANAEGLTSANGYGAFRAWISSSTDDAYCRMHGLGDKKANNCGLGALPVAAGPWVNRSGAPFAPRIDRLLAPTRQLFNPQLTREDGGAVLSSATVFTGTDDAGVAIASSTCNDWTSSSSAVTGARGDVTGAGGGSWTDALATDPSCFAAGQLRCMEVVDATAQGPSLNPRPTTGRHVFVTSVMGTGQMSTWPDSNGTNGSTGADEVCRARARFAGYTNFQAFEALLGTSSLSGTGKFSTSTGPWFRPDGMAVATSENELFFGTRLSAIAQTETGAYLQGAADSGGVWTGTSTTGGFSSFHCSSWTSTGSSGTTGRHDYTDSRWLVSTSPSSTATCTTQQRLYCYED